MKVFLSWSGGRSHKVALIFRDWLPSVIQEIEPYVSSEDIDKGARWSTDIAKELENSTFGILCVTRDNINAPWLTFEAGALSKTMDKSFVSPFLFDIKRSEVDGPILQFQSTTFEKEDLQKLINTLNKACEKDRLSSDRLSKAFEVWYPTLEQELNSLKGKSEQHEEKPEEGLKDAHTQEILEEILDLSRINQKLIRNPEGTITSYLEETRDMVRHLLERQNHEMGPRGTRHTKRFHPMMLDELIHISSIETENSTIGIQMVLAMIREEFPWIYETGLETIKIIKSRVSRREKESALRGFFRILEFSFDHPLVRERMDRDKEWSFIYRELPHLLEHAFERALDG